MTTRYTENELKIITAALLAATEGLCWDFSTWSRTATAWRAALANETSHSWLSSTCRNLDLLRP
jgi:hypothetical protein